MTRGWWRGAVVTAVVALVSCPSWPEHRQVHVANVREAALRLQAERLARAKAELSSRIGVIASVRRGQGEPELRSGATLTFGRPLAFRPLDTSAHPKAPQACESDPRWLGGPGPHPSRSPERVFDHPRTETAALAWERESEARIVASRLEELEAFFPERLDAAELDVTLRCLAETCGVGVERLTMPSCETETIYPEHRELMFGATLVGTEPALRCWFESVPWLHLLIMVDSVWLQPTDPGSPYVRAHVVLRVYLAREGRREWATRTISLD